MIRRPPRSTHCISSAASDVYKRQQKYISGNELSKTLLEAGILCKETHESTIRFAPPLVVTKEELDWGIEKIAKVFSEVTKS